MKIAIILLAITVVAESALRSECGRRLGSSDDASSTEHWNGFDGLFPPWQVSLQRLYIVKDGKTLFLNPDEQRKFWSGLSPKEVAGVSQIFRHHWCNGAAVSDKHVVTLAHCIPQTTPADVTKCSPSHNDQFNGFSILTATDSVHSLTGARGANEYEIYWGIRHPNFTKSGDHFSSDIAVIEVIKRFNGATIPPVCLPTVKDTFPESMRCLVSGWGQSSNNTHHFFSEKLLIVDNITIWDQQACIEHRRMPGYPEDELCADNIPSDLCMGNDGSQLSCLSNGKFYLMGILQVGDCKNRRTDHRHRRFDFPLTDVKKRTEECGKRGGPARFVHLLHHVPWINRTNFIGDGCYDRAISYPRTIQLEY